MKRKTILLILLLFIIIIVLFFYQFQKKSWNKEISYLDSSIVISITTNKNGKKILDHIEKIYQKYEKLIDRENAYDNMHNLYYVLYNQSKDSKISIDPILYDFIAYGKKWYKKSNGQVDISIGNVINIWDMYIDSTSGYPSDKELNKAKTESINDVILLGNHKIQNNHVNIYLDEISKSYITDKVIAYLKKEKVVNYQISIDQNMYVGKKKNDYKLAITNPFGNYIIVTASDIAISNRYETDHSYTYSKQTYNHLISSSTLRQPRKMKGISVITNNVKESDALSYMLYMMDLEEGREYAENHNIAVIWYTNEKKILYSTKMQEYIKQKESVL